MDIITIPKTFNHKKFKIITLNNGIKCVLIQDKYVKKSYCSMSVRIGSYQDPPDVEGLAHFLEHMLFMGSEKYPDENYYSKFLKSNNGGSNAFTDSLSTNYYLSIDSDAFLEAFDIFAQFFICPLFKSDSVDREMNAVNSEHNKNINSDSWRKMRVFSKIFNRKHPASQFSTGNLETLSKPDIRQRLLDFYDKYYKSENMKLVVLSNHSFDILEKEINDKFSVIERGSTLIELPELINIRDQQFSQLYSLIEIKTVKNNNTLEILWYIGDTTDYYHLKAEEYIVHLLGHEYSGGLAYKLKKIGLINSLYSSVYRENAYDSFIQIGFDLTKKGLKNTKYIIISLHNYIKKIKKDMIDVEFFRELQITSENAFKYKQPGDSTSLVLDIAEHIDIYPDEDLLFFNYRTDDFSNSTIDRLNELFEMMKPEKTIVILQNNTLSENEEGIKIEKYYGVLYRIRFNIIYPKNKSCLKVDDFETLLVNDFLTENIELVKEPEDENPVKIENYKLEIWKQTVTHLMIPNVIVNIYLKPLDIDLVDPINNIYIEFLLELYQLEYYDKYYNMSIAGYDFSIDIQSDNIIITLSGFPNKIDRLVEELLTDFFEFTIDEDIFKKNKEQFEIMLKNFKFETPINIARTQISKMLIKDFKSPCETLKIVEEITIEDLNNILNLLKKGNDSIIYIIGNCNMKIINNIYAILNEFKFVSFERKPTDRNPFNEIKSRKKISVKQTDETDDAVVSLYYSNHLTWRDTSDEHYKDKICTMILSEIMSESFFNELRTMEQLGYIVSNGFFFKGITSYEIYGIVFFVQSSVMKTRDLKDRINRFVREFYNKLINMSDIETIIETTKSEYMERDKNLSMISDRNFKQIVSRKFQFNIREILLRILDTLTRKDIVDKYNSIFVDPSNIVSMVTTS